MKQSAASAPTKMYLSRTRWIHPEAALIQAVRTVRSIFDFMDGCCLRYLSLFASLASVVGRVAWITQRMLFARLGFFVWIFVWKLPSDKLHVYLLFLEVSELQKKLTTTPDHTLLVVGQSTMGLDETEKKLDMSLDEIVSDRKQEAAAAAAAAGAAPGKLKST